MLEDHTVGRTPLYIHPHQNTLTLLLVQTQAMKSLQLSSRFIKVLKSGQPVVRITDALTSTLGWEKHKKLECGPMPRYRQRVHVRSLAMYSE